MTPTVFVCTPRPTLHVLKVLAKIPPREIKGTVGGGIPNFHYRVFTIIPPRVTLYRTDKDTFGDILVRLR